MAASGPFTETHLERWRSALKSLDEGDELLNRLARLGEDVSTERRRSAEERERLVALINEFFPGR